MDYAFTDALREQMRTNLASVPALSLDVADYLHAAVGVVLVPDTEGRACFVLTRRLPTLRRHAGQWALPGGRLEPGELPEAAAVRETFEEVGLWLPPESVLGRLDDFPTRSGHLITPIVAWSPSSVMVVSPDEVHAAYLVPIAELDEPGNPRHAPFLHFELRVSAVHAPTAAILYQFRDVALHGRPTRVAHLDQPPFARQ